MWYPLIETGCQRGTSRAQNSIMSTTILSDGSGGQIHSFCAMNSFSMSFWMVPPSCVQGTPCSSATARYMASSARVVGVVAHEGRHVEGGGEPRLALLQEEVEALVGVLGGGEAGELAHGPEPAAVHARVDAARVGELARDADALGRVRREVLGRV